MKEIWKDIDGYEGLYQVSNLGRVKSLERTIHVGKGFKTTRVVEEKIMAPRNHNGGYYSVCLSNGKTKYQLIHRLVAHAFIDNPEGYEQVNHKNENKKDNSAENLEWCNQSYNVRYNDLNLRGTAKRSKPVIQATKDGKIICIWKSANDAGRNLGIQQGNISACCNGRIKSTGGYAFWYLNREIERVSR